jgi:hypothetical protein
MYSRVPVLKIVIINHSGMERVKGLGQRDDNWDKSQTGREQTHDRSEE